MIDQKFQQPGLLAETEVNPLFPRMADLVLVFFPSPGVFVRNTLTIPEEFKTEATVSVSYTHLTLPTIQPV